MRRALGIRTIMNVLGPCVNPAEPPVQLLGVAEERLLEPVALTLAALGVERAMVVHGAGLDEIALHGETKAVRLAGGALEALTIAPEDVGFARAPLGADPGRRAGGECRAAEGPALRLRHAGGDAGGGAQRRRPAVHRRARRETLREGVETALDDRSAPGAGHRLLQALVEISHG